MTRTNLGDVPNQPKTPSHSFRVSDELWAEAKRKAQGRGETITDVLKRALEEYVKTKEK